MTKMPPESGAIIERTHAAAASPATTPEPDARKRPRRVVVVSNRVALPRDLKPGGLALAMRIALREWGGVWLGWSGKIGAEDAPMHVEKEGDVTFATLDLSASEYDEYYNGFANRALWPLFHFRPDLVDFKRNDWHAYIAVNRRFADALVGLVEPDDLIWVHDYHLIPLASLLRAQGVRARMGFFLHTPFPPLDLLRMLPVHRELFEAFAAYDLIGFHTRDYLRAFREYIAEEVGSQTNESGMTSVNGGRRSFRTGVFPIGIDVDRVAHQAARASRSRSVRALVESLAGRALVIGVDRLDYSKGLPARFRAFGRFLDESPEHHRAVTLLQIAPVSRTDVAEYGLLRKELEGIAGAINGQHAEADWTAVRYVNRSYPQATLAGFFRAARVGLVTPLRDGMNLVAKEYVAAQDPDDPGVLVLSRFAGAAQELDGAILVNPHDAEAVADALRAALVMPLPERQSRWRAMMDVLRRNDIDAWRNGFLATLGA